MTKAILIDSKNKSITEVEKGEGIEDIYKHLGEGVRCFSVISLGGGVDMFIDDEGLLREAYIDENGEKHNMTGIQLDGYPQVIMGNGLIVGTDDMGETIDCPVSVRQVEAVVTLVELDDPNDRPQPFMEFVSF